MIYVPDDTKPCVVVQNATTIRVYDSQPRNNSSSSYRDYYPSMSYAFTQGVQSWGTTSNLPSCLNRSEYTSQYIYRTDIDSILLSVVILLVLGVYMPLQIIRRLFRR